MTEISYPKYVLIYGMGGYALVILAACKTLGYEVVGFFDDNDSYLSNQSKNLPPYLGPYQSDFRPELPLIIAIGNNEVRKDISFRIQHRLFTLIHPTAIIAPTAVIGEGCVILQAAIVQANASIGRQSIVNAGVVIDHEAVLGDYCHVRPLAYVGGAAHVLNGTTVPPLQLIERFSIYG